jgi:hypothetical protein
MVTLAQAKKLRYGQTLFHARNRNADGTAQRWRVSGKPRTWKRDKSKVSVPIKHGLYNHDHLDQHSLKLLRVKEPKYKKRKRSVKRKR